MADIIAQLQVLSRDSGCLLDISALLDLAICPKVNIQTKRPHKISQSPDYVTVTPTEKKKTTKESKTTTKYAAPQYTQPTTSYFRRGASHYEVPQKVCSKNTVTQDLGLLVPLGLLTKEELEDYLHKTGALPAKDSIPSDQTVDVDPLLGLDVGKDGSLLDLDVGSKDGLLDATVGKSGDKSLLNLGLLDKNGLLTLGLNGKTIINLRRDTDDPLAFVQAGGKKIPQNAPIDLTALTGSGDPLAVVQAGGKKIDNNAPIQVSALTHDRRADSDDPLAHVQVGGEKTDENSAIDLSLLTDALDAIADVQVGGKKNNDKNPLINLDLLTHDGSDDSDSDDSGSDNSGSDGSDSGSNGSNGQNNSGSDGSNGNKGSNGNNGNNNGNKGSNGQNGGKDNSGSNNGENSSSDSYNTYSTRGDYSVSNSNSNSNSQSTKHYNTHYQPMCNKGFTEEHLKSCDKEEATDVNHCLAICQAKAALLTLDADVKVGDVANIQVCIAIEFNESAQDGNCRYLVAPETKPCEDSYLEEKKDCYAFVRN